MQDMLKIYMYSVLCFYLLEKTRVEVLRTKNTVRTQAIKQEFAQLFQVLTNFHES